MWQDMAPPPAPRDVFGHHKAALDAAGQLRKRRCLIVSHCELGCSGRRSTRGGTAGARPARITGPGRGRDDDAPIAGQRGRRLVAVVLLRSENGCGCNATAAARQERTARAMDCTDGQRGAARRSAPRGARGEALRDPCAGARGSHTLERLAGHAPERMNERPRRRCHHCQSINPARPVHHSPNMTSGVQPSEKHSSRRRGRREDPVQSQRSRPGARSTQTRVETFAKSNKGIEGLTCRDGAPIFSL
jgi:hypothetical protein